MSESAEFARALEVEFDTVASWTADAVGELGSEYAIAAACRGSGSPAALEWLAQALLVRERTTLLDAGAGLGGPAAFAAYSFGALPMLAEPMLGACRAARDLFALPVVAAGGQQLPFANATFDAAWSLGVLCTTTAKLEFLQELRRVTRPGGRVGLLVYVRTSDALPLQPEGNAFPTSDELDDLLAAVGLTTIGHAELRDFSLAPDAWQRQTEQVETLIAQRHRHDARWQLAQSQQQAMVELLSGGLVAGRLVATQA